MSEDTVAEDIGNYDDDDNVKNKPKIVSAVGLELEDVRMLLSEMHNAKITLDEPILLVATLLNAYLTEIEKLHSRHNEAVTKIMASQSEKYITEVKGTTDRLSRVLANASVEAIRLIFDAHGSQLVKNTLNNKWCSAIVAISALANIAVLAFHFWSK